MQDYTRLGITSIQDRKRLFQLVQSLRQQQDSLLISNLNISKPTMLTSSVSCVKKSASSVGSPVPTLSSPRILTSKSFYHHSNKKPPLQLQSQSEDEDEEDETKVIQQSVSFMTPYGLPNKSARARPQAKSDLNQKIRVCVRKRPLSKKEMDKNEKDIMPVAGVRTVHVNEPKLKVDLTKYIEQHQFTFDDVFDADSTNDYIYQRTAQPLVKYIFSGGKATCFAYGQTGSGKTYTMMDPQHGLYILAARDIFDMLHQPEYQHLDAWIGFYEIYQGQLYDLLGQRKKLFAREDGKQNVVIVGLKEYRIKTVSDLMQVFEYGNQIRSTGSTGANSDSSRSHAILQVLLKPKENKKKIIGKLSFIDLAGSERGADRGEADVKTRMEGAEINKSLLALKECIRALDQDKKHTPFRQSKLTQVLKDSFVGNSRTCMIATVSPNQSNSDHTLNTLRYGDRVKELKGEKQQENLWEDHETITVLDEDPSLFQQDFFNQSDAITAEDSIFSQEPNTLVDTDFPHEVVVPPPAIFKASTMDDFLSYHRAEIRATNESSKKETKLLAHVCLGVYQQEENNLKVSSEFIDYLGNLDEELEIKTSAIEALRDRIRMILQEHDQ
ncbi:kinesin-domain-containing protein [Backusella circina FSU 941]|nr:kinesin-domain-containing protein [Backusella circina FSU 941]